MASRKSYESKNSTYYMYSKHAVIAAIRNPRRTIEQIFVTSEFLRTYPRSLDEHKPKIVDNNFLSKLLVANLNHQGIVARVQTIFLDDIKNVDLSDPNCKIAILDQITDPQNIGAIIRSAAAFGIKAIILPQDNSPIENSTIAKIASGTLELVNIVKVPNLKNVIEFLKKQNFWVVGFDGSAESNLNQEILKGKIVLALGSEDRGLRRLTAEACDYLVKIPMSSEVESLNVSNAASIAFYLASL